MKKITFLSFIWLFHFHLVVHAQASIGNYPLQVSGEIPGFLYTSLKRYLIPEENDWTKTLNHQDQEHFLNMIYESGMVVYGDPVSNFCSSLIKKCGFNDNPVYLVRSNEAGCFANSKGELFITSGLIQQCRYESQITFWLLRAAHAWQQGLDPHIVPWNYNIQECSRAVYMLKHFYDEDEKLLDSLAFNQLYGLSNYNTEELSTVFEPALMQGLPFYLDSISVDDLSSSHFFVPKTAWQKHLPHAAARRHYQPRRKFEWLAAREKKYVNLGLSTNIGASRNLMNLSEFKLITELCRMEYLNQLVLEGRFSLAAYTAYQLELNGYDGDYLRHLKAAAWYGFAHEYIERYNFRDAYEFEETSDLPPAVFGRFMRAGEYAGAWAMAVRVLYDLQAKYPSPDIEFLYSDLVSFGSHKAFFKLDSYYNITYQQAASMKNIDLNAAENQTGDPVALKLLGNFCFYLLHDLLDQQEFKELIKPDAALAKDISSKPASIQLIGLDYRRYSRSKELKQTANATPDEISQLVNTQFGQYGITVNEAEKLKDNEAYQLKYLLSYTLAQQYYHGAYQRKTRSVYGSELQGLLKKSGEGSSAIILYRQNYAPALHAIDYAALFVLPLPYLIPQFFMCGNRKTSAVFIFSSETSAPECMSYRRLRDPDNPHMFKQLLHDAYQKNYQP